MDGCYKKNSYMSLLNREEWHVEFDCGGGALLLCGAPI
jgi:hypothetical protein